MTNTDVRYTLVIPYLCRPLPPFLAHTLFPLNCEANPLPVIMTSMYVFDGCLDCVSVIIVLLSPSHAHILFLHRTLSVYFQMHQQLSTTPSTKPTPGRLNQQSQVQCTAHTQCRANAYLPAPKTPLQELPRRQHRAALAEVAARLRRC